MRVNIETLINAGWTQVNAIKAAITDDNKPRLEWLLVNLPAAEDHLLTYRSNEVAVSTLTKAIAAEQAKQQPDADKIAQMVAEKRRALQYMIQADGRLELILFDYGKRP